MLSSYIKLALRNFAKYKFHSFINLFGLSIGISSTILIILFLYYHLGFDSFHTNVDNLYRVSIKSERNGEFENESYEFVAPLAEAMYNDMPEVKNYCRISNSKTAYFYVNNNPYKVTDFHYADSTFFDLFSFVLLEGNIETVLKNPYSIVLTESEAYKLFGDSNVIGNVILLDNKTGYTVTGIVKDNPSNSHIKYNALVSFSTLYSEPGHYMDWNGGNQYYHYVLLKDNVLKTSIDNKFKDFMWKYINKDLAGIGISFKPYLQKFSDIHLHFNRYSDDLRTNLSIFAIGAVLILLIACVNFINLSTAKSVYRSKEIGVRKVLGAFRITIVKQLLTESIILTSLAVVLSIFIVELLLPAYRNLLGEQIPSLNLAEAHHIVWLVSLVLVIGFIAGSYPAFYMTKQIPIKTLHGNIGRGKQKTRFRNLLIVIQFTIAIALIISTAFVTKQLSLFKNFDPGYDKENILVLELSTKQLQEKASLLKTELTKLPFVRSVSAVSDVPFNGFTSNGYFPQDFTEPMLIHVVDVDSDFLQTFNLQIVNGDNFIKDSQADNNDYIINEALAGYLNWSNPVGMTIRRNGIHNVRGVVKDFNYASLYNEVDPLIITNAPYGNEYNYLAVKMNMASVSASLKNIETVWNETVPNNPFEYFFLEEAFNSVYRSEEHFQTGFAILSLLAIILSVLGLVGLISFTTEQRVKEIGIRKVLGASMNDILMDLTKSYILIICGAILIGWMIAFWSVSAWLQQFAYKIDQTLLVYFVSGAAALFISVLSIYFTVLRAASINPADALKYE